MAIVNEGGGGGGSSTDTGVCAISPSDLVSYTGNGLNRIKSLEQRVAELEAAIVQVNQLSDLSQQVGWVGNVIYMGVEGWTQTEYGTLIPPPGVSFSSLGFTLSDGNTYPFVVMDENGVLQYGFTNTGGVGGALSGSVSDYIVLDDSSAARPPAFTTVASLGTALSCIGDNVISISAAGLYMITFHCSFKMPTAATDQDTAVDIYNGTTHYYVTNYYNKNTADGTQQNQTITTTFAWYLASGYTLTFTYGTAGTSGAPMVATVVRLTRS